MLDNPGLDGEWKRVTPNLSSPLMLRISEVEARFIDGSSGSAASRTIAVSKVRRESAQIDSRYSSAIHPRNLVHCLGVEGAWVTKIFFCVRAVVTS